MGQDRAKITKWLKTRLEVSTVHAFGDLDKSNFQNFDISRTTYCCLSEQNISNVCVEGKMQFQSFGILL